MVTPAHLADLAVRAAHASVRSQLWWLRPMLSLSPVLPDALPPRQMEVAVGQRPAALAGDLRGGGRKGGGARGRAGGRARRGWSRNRRSRKRSQLLKNKTILPLRVRRQQQAKAGAGAAGRNPGAAAAVGFSGSGL
eukprot:COSAG01_NODE_1954_length_8817_cov_18.303166_5_plen_136_part_00